MPLFDLFAGSGAVNFHLSNEVVIRAWVSLEDPRDVFLTAYDGTDKLLEMRTDESGDAYVYLRGSHDA